MNTFKKILSLTYSEARAQYPVAGNVCAARRIITFRNDTNVDSLSSESDVVVYYDVVTESTPLLLVERIKRSEMTFEEVLKYTRQIQEELDDYVIQAVECSNIDYIDIVIVKKNIVENILRGES